MRRTGRAAREPIHLASCGAASPSVTMGSCDFPGGKVAQLNSKGVNDDVLIGFVDRLVRAVVVFVLFVAYLSWLERSPMPALLIGSVVAVGVRLWRRAPRAADDRPATAWAGASRATAIGDVDLMTGREFQQLIARLMRRDSFVGVQATGLRDDLSTDVVGQTSEGHKVVVVCNRDAPRRRVGPTDVERALGMAYGGHLADIAVLVTTGRFTRAAMALGERSNVVLLDRAQLAAWMTGRTTPLTPYLAASV